MRSLYNTKEYFYYRKILNSKEIIQMPIKEVLNDFFLENDKIPVKEKESIKKIIYYQEERVIVFKSLIGDIMYENLYEANCKLIDAFINNTDRSEVHYSLDGEGMKKEFYKLYFENGYSEFRGVR